MAQLHLTRAAPGCHDIGALEARLAGRCHGGELRVATARKPRRADELIGGALHWIVKHRIVARSPILRFDDRDDGRIDIVCGDRLERIVPVPRRAHQGWRYYESDAPEAANDDSGLAELPPALYGRLAALLLV